MILHLGVLLFLITHPLGGLVFRGLSQQKAEPPSRLSLSFYSLDNWFLLLPGQYLTLGANSSSTADC